MLKMVPTICIYSLILLMTGCAGLGGVTRQVQISSIPAGASVFANGVEIGKTPMNIDQDVTFPPRWGNMAYQSSGVLSLKKRGCETHTTQVSDGMLSKNITIKLVCKNIVEESVVEKVSNPSPVTNKSMSGNKADDSKRQGKAVVGKTEKRLKELKELHKKGVITEQEYNATRKRILSEI